MHYIKMLLCKRSVVLYWIFMGFKVLLHISKCNRFYFSTHVEFHIPYLSVFETATFKIIIWRSPQWSGQLIKISWELKLLNRGSMKFLHLDIGVKRQCRYYGKLCFSTHLLNFILSANWYKWQFNVFLEINRICGSPELKAILYYYFLEAWVRVIVFCIC